MPSRPHLQTVSVFVVLCTSSIVVAQGPSGPPDDRFHIGLPPVQSVAAGATFTFPVHLDSTAGSQGPAVHLQSWSYAVCLDTTQLDPLSITFGADISTITNGGPPIYLASVMPGEGFRMGVIVDLFGTYTLPPGTDIEIDLLTCAAVGTAPYISELLICSSVGIPPRDISVVPVGGYPSVLPLTTDGQVAVGGDPFRRGDCKTDGHLALDDAVHLLAFLFLPTPTTVDCELACDANDDDAIAIPDAIAILNYLFGHPSIALPPPTCGLDPTPGLLGCVNLAVCP